MKSVRQSIRESISKIMTFFRVARNNDNHFLFGAFIKGFDGRLCYSCEANSLHRFSVSPYLVLLLGGRKEVFSNVQNCMNFVGIDSGTHHAYKKIFGPNVLLYFGVDTN